MSLPPRQSLPSCIEWEGMRQRSSNLKSQYQFLQLRGPRSLTTWLCEKWAQTQENRIYMNQARNAWVLSSPGNKNSSEAERTFGDKGVVKCLSQSRAAQYKAISHRKASLAPRNVAPPSNTLLATLLSLTILEKGSKITGEQWWRPEGKSHDYE